MLFTLAKVWGGNEPTPEGSEAVRRTESQTHEHEHGSDDKGNQRPPDIESSSDEDSLNHINKQDLKGVQKIEAVTLTWSRNELIVAYACIFLVFCVNSLQQQITNNLTAYVYSSFASHSLLTVSNTVAFLLAGILKLPVAQMMNLWGRAEGLILMTVSATVGLVMMAACKNVQTYVAAQCFYWFGFNGISYVLQVFIADTSGIQNRALAFAFSTSPYIATTFAGPAAAQAFYDNSTFQWAFGCFAIITPVITLPILYILYNGQRRAAKLNMIQKELSGRTFLQSFVHYFMLFDFIGVFLLTGGLAMFLLSFSLAGYQKDTWKSATILCLLIIGFFTIVAFVVYEKWFCKRSFVPWELMADKTVIGALVLYAVLFLSFYLWDSYFFSYLQVVHGINIRNTGYIFNIYSIGSCFWGIVVAILIKFSGRNKWLALYFGMPIITLGCGLMIHFRQPDHNIGYVIMSQIFIAFGGGTLVITGEIAAMAVSKHTEMAQILALLGLSSSVGGAIAGAMSGAIWWNTVPGALAKALPQESSELLDEIYGDITKQMSYDFGTPIRTAINAAYGEAQKRMCIAATVVLVLGWLSVLTWRDVRLADVRTVKGRVL